ncbi:O-methyltransferase [Polluticaenibacter yanchengensis]|uniref:O-methyltransferase n=1 Tax=Polluticaenibacter yanchengensis TaxID=3014562 RepID=A0ABT4UM09_9BACT|nr:O-methyltransferase [Chitinophagaceae bacterium LY-5]
MMDLLYTPEAYAELNSSEPDTLAKELLAYTMANHASAHLASSALQGALLSQLSQMIQPRRILEIGTFTGFSALCLADGLADDGILFTLELRQADADTAQSFFDRSDKRRQMKILVGDAKDIIAENLNNECWDLVFIDADKVGYLEYYELVLPNVRKGGFIIADNVLFHGEVLKDTIKGKNPKAIAAFNEHVKNDNRVFKVMVPLRDGLTIMRKL